MLTLDQPNLRHVALQSFGELFSTCLCHPRMREFSNQAIFSQPQSVTWVRSDFDTADTLSTSTMAWPQAPSGKRRRHCLSRLRPTQ
jgi:hypothetical protein